VNRFLLPFALAFAVAPLSAQQPAGDLLFARFERYLEALRLQAGIPGLSAAIIGPAETAWERSFGLENVERAMAARPDTPFHLDGLTQMFTATLVLRCAEEGRLDLNAPVGRFAEGLPEPDATIAQVLSHTVPTPTGAVYAFRPDRLEWLVPAVQACTGDSFRGSLAGLLERLAMIDAVPGPDAVTLLAPVQGSPATPAVERFTSALSRLATSYLVEGPGRASPVEHPAFTLGASGGLLASVRDLARFDLALKSGVLLTSETLAVSWSPPPGAGPQPLPHGLGWFVQTFNGQKVVWQFGVMPGASSSLVVMVPARGLTLVLLANSDGLALSFPLAAGDVTVSPFARSFLGLVLP